MEIQEKGVKALHEKWNMPSYAFILVGFRYVEAFNVVIVKKHNAGRFSSYMKKKKSDSVLFSLGKYIS